MKLKKARQPKGRSRIHDPPEPNPTDTPDKTTQLPGPGPETSDGASSGSTQPAPKEKRRLFKRFIKALAHPSNWRIFKNQQSEPLEEGQYIAVNSSPSASPSPALSYVSVKQGKPEAQTVHNQATPAISGPSIHLPVNKPLPVLPIHGECLTVGSRNYEDSIRTPKTLEDSDIGDASPNTALLLMDVDTTSPGEGTALTPASPNTNATSRLLEILESHETGGCDGILTNAIQGDSGNTHAATDSTIPPNPSIIEKGPIVEEARTTILAEQYSTPGEAKQVQPDSRNPRFRRESEGDKPTGVWSATVNGTSPASEEPTRTVSNLDDIYPARSLRLSRSNTGDSENGMDVDEDFPRGVTSGRSKRPLSKPASSGVASETNSKALVVADSGDYHQARHDEPAVNNHYHDSDEYNPPVPPRRFNERELPRFHEGFDDVQDRYYGADGNDSSDVDSNGAAEGSISDRSNASPDPEARYDDYYAGPIPPPPPPPPPPEPVARAGLSLFLPADGGLGDMRTARWEFQPDAELTYTGGILANMGHVPRASYVIGEQTSQPLTIVIW